MISLTDRYSILRGWFPWKCTPEGNLLWQDPRWTLQLCSVLHITFNLANILFSHNFHSQEMRKHHIVELYRAQIFTTDGWYTSVNIILPKSIKELHSCKNFIAQIRSDLQYSISNYQKTDDDHMTMSINKYYTLFYGLVVLAYDVN